MGRRGRGGKIFGTVDHRNRSMHEAKLSSDGEVDADVIKLWRSSETTILVTSTSTLIESTYNFHFNHSLFKRESP